jgi:uncharacterized repeat protein (TIGR01451 family)
MLPTTGTVTGTYQWNATYSGDANNTTVSEIDNADEQVTVNPANPTLSTIPNPTTVTLGDNSVTLTDSATLSAGFNPTGTITFTLFYKGGSTPLDTETVAINGNGIYTTPSGFTLPSTGMVTGTYQWNATYSSDGNNNTASEVNNVNERVAVSAASPTLLTTPSPTTVKLGTNSVTLTDSAVLAGGFNPTGSITFTLTYNSTVVDAETVTVNGNGSYTTLAGFTLPTTSTVTGTYQWDTTYSGDSNNITASDINSASEQVTVTSASPAISTTPNPNAAHLGVTLQDVANLVGGFSPTGSITFNLYGPGVDPTVGPAIHTESVTVNGNGTYHTTTGFVTNVTGTWHWVATYGGDSNNNSVSSGPLDEPVSVPQQADVSVTKTPSTQMVVFGMTLTYTFVVQNLGPDSATNVVVTDPFPNPGLAFVSAATPSQGTFTFNPSNLQGIWDVGALANGASATLEIVAEVTSTGPIVNTATVETATFDPDLSNNFSSVPITGMEGPGDISKRDFLSSSDPPAPGPITVGWHYVVTGDFLGNGKTDIAGMTASGQWWVAVSNGSSFTNQLWTTWNAAAGWHDVVAGDFLGNGKTDIAGMTAGGQWWVALSTGSSFMNSLWTTWNPNVTWADIKVGDFEGDGKADIAGRVQATGQWWTALSTGSSFVNSLWATWSAAVTWVDVKVGDFDGDGKTDVTGRWLQGGSWWTGISTGSSFSTTQWTAWNPNVTWADVQVGDFDGDGKADISGRVLQSGQWWTALSTGSSFVSSLWDIWDSSVTWVDVKVADFNGDGKADLIGRVPQTGQWWLAESTGAAFSNSLWDTWSTAVTWADVNVGDFDGSGFPGLVGRIKQNGQWWAAMPNGTSITNQLWTAWSK